MADSGVQPSESHGAAASPSVGRTGSQSQRRQSLDGGSVQGGSIQGTPASLSLNPSQQLAAPGTGLRNASGGPTPLTHGRPDLGYVGLWQPMSAQRRSSMAPSESLPISSEGEGEGEATYIWGTNLSVARIQSRFNVFVREFREEGEEDPKYLRLLQETYQRGDVSFNIDGAHIYSYDKALYNWAITYPAETVPIFDGQLAAIMAELVGTDPEEFQFQSRIYNLRETKVIRDLNPSDINKLIAVSGMVTRTSGVIPDQSLALFRCTVCGKELLEWNDRGKINEPAKCPNPSCQAAFSMAMVYNRSSFLDKQLMKMQENPNEIPEGETPHTVSMFARQDLVDLAKPGDRITVTGVYRAVGVRTSPRLRELKSVYKTYLDIVHIQRDETAQLFSLFTDESQRESQSQQQSQQEPNGRNLADAPNTEDQLGARSTNNMTNAEVEAKRQQFQELAADPELYEKLAASIAPSIWQLEDVKKGILCLLFGGVSKALPGSKTRGEMNVLLVGDPGVSKSQILGYVHKVAPRGIYTSGKGSSAVGLTAYVTKDPETREMVLESGALVLSDRGVCCIDEFDKMSESARSMLHEVMEQQTISVAKAGIIATLNARTSVLACANPVGSRYNPSLSVVENIQLPPSLMSRFDLIYLLLDKADESSDRKLARHLVALYGKDERHTAQAPISLDVLREFIAYARATCHPELAPEAAQELARAYTDMRSQGMSRKIVSATPRQLESLIRISEALAKMRLAPAVTVQDVKEAERLMRVSMQQASIDPRTGQIDMDVIQTGVSAADRTMKAQLAGELKALLDQHAGSGLRLAELMDLIGAQSSVRVSERDVRQALAELEDSVRFQNGIISLRA